MQVDVFCRSFNINDVQFWAQHTRDAHTRNVMHGGHIRNSWPSIYVRGLSLRNAHTNPFTNNNNTIIRKKEEQPIATAYKPGMCDMCVSLCVSLCAHWHRFPRMLRNVCSFQSSNKRDNYSSPAAAAAAAGHPQPSR